MPQTMQCGQIVKVFVTVSNAGATDLRQLHVTCSEPNMIFIPEYTTIGAERPAAR